MTDTPDAEFDGLPEWVLPILAEWDTPPVEEYHRFEVAEFLPQMKRLCHGWATDRRRLVRARTALGNLLSRVPSCSCATAYTARELTDPNCPLCNWFEDEIVKEARKALAEMDGGGESRS